MSKVATIASLIRSAARTEEDFMTTGQAVMDDEEVDRVAEFWDRLNIPRSVGAEELLHPLGAFRITVEHIGNYDEERQIADGIQKFLDRHERKIKWHATHPSLVGTENVLLLLRAAMITTSMRLERLQLLLRSKDDLTPHEWAISREMMNRSYLSFRNFMNLASGMWIDAVIATVPRDELAEKIGSFYELVDEHIRALEDHRTRIEERRMELTVLPDGFPPVRPPVYFGGDLLGRGPWRQYWENIQMRAHHFRESMG